MKKDIMTDKDISRLRKELESTGPVDPVLAKQAEEFVNTLLTMSGEDFNARREHTEQVDNLGRDVQRRAALESRMLKQPIKKLAQEGDKKLMHDLIDLKVKVEELDPSVLNFAPTKIRKALGRFIGSPAKKYLTKYESGQTVINSIVTSLEHGREELDRDNITLAEDQKLMRETTIRLRNVLGLGLLINDRLDKQLDTNMNDEQRRFISDEIIFPLRQRILDLQQQLAVNQQGILTTELIIRNNKELARGVNRVINVTVSALEIGVAVTMALANQKNVIDNIETVNKTTSTILSNTAQKLKTQGAAIQKQATNAMLDIEAMKTAFANIVMTFDDIASFRREALPKMAEQIRELDKLSNQAEQEISKIDRGVKLDLLSA